MKKKIVKSAKIIVERLGMLSLSILVLTAILGIASAVYVTHIRNVDAVGESLNINAPVTFSGSNVLKTYRIESPSSTSYYLDPANATSSLVTAGNVGIGGTTVDARLAINTYNGRQIRAVSWADMSSNACGPGMFAGNGYTMYDGSTCTYRYSNTHGSIGAAGVLANYPNGSDVSLFTSGGTTSTANSTFTPSVALTARSTGNVGIGSTAPTSKLNISGGGLRVGTQATDLAGTDGSVSLGSTTVNYAPTSGNWTVGGAALLLSGLDYTTIGFHDAGNRVDWIRVGAGAIDLGYNGGWGAASVNFGGSITCMAGYCPANGIARMTPNLHLNSQGGYAVILNWDNGTTGNTATFRIGNGASADVFQVFANGNTYLPFMYDSQNTSYYVDPNSVSQLNDIRSAIWYDLNNTGYYLDGNGTTYLNVIQAASSMYAPIFYDIQNGGFYVDPNANSNINTMSTAGSLTVGGALTANAALTVAGGITITTGSLNATGATINGLYFHGNYPEANVSYGLCYAGGDQYIRDCTGTPGDLAEWYPTRGDVTPGDIIMEDPSETITMKTQGQDYYKKRAKLKDYADQTINYTKKATKGSQILGVMSTAPDKVMGEQILDILMNYDEESNTYTPKDANKKPIPVALAGRTLVKVSSENGAIEPGDAITLSATKPGVGVKATEAGYIVGKALQAYNGDGVGSTMVLVGNAWYDPDVYLTSTGDINVIVEGNKATVKKEDGSIVTRVAAFAEAVVGKLKVGIVEAKKVVVNGVDILEKLNKLSATVDKQEKEIKELKDALKKVQADTKK